MLPEPGESDFRGEPFWWSPSDPVDCHHIRLERISPVTGLPTVTGRAAVVKTVRAVVSVSPSLSVGIGSDKANPETIAAVRVRVIRIFGQTALKGLRKILGG
ncbi:MAG: hypothetical protein P1V20_01775 [Verrucomicrobiales bacterium]|nr:hypothetical protein [Verrucomicrobiales bacterium]